MIVSRMFWKRYGFWKRRRIRSKRVRKPRSRFWWRRRQLHYHLVIRCRRRSGNSPDVLVDGSSRRSLLRISRIKRLAKSKRKKLRYKTNCSLRYYNELLTQQRPSVLLLDTVSREILDQFVSSVDYFGLDQQTTSFALESVTTTAEDLIKSIVPRVYFVGDSLYWHQDYGIYNTTRVDTPMVWDTGASIGLTPYRDDFLTYQPVNTTVTTVGGPGKIVGVGICLFKVVANIDGGEPEFEYIPAVCYHMPSADIRLFSPQMYFGKFGGSGCVTEHGVDMTLANGKHVHLPLDPFSGLPMFKNCSVTAEEKMVHGEQYKFEAHSISLHEFLPGISSGEMDISPSESVFGQTCCLTVADETNQNMTEAQKELLQLHWKLCINMHRIQELCRPVNIYDDAGNVVSVSPPVLPTKLKSTATCAHPVCMSCKLANMKVRNPKVSSSKAVESSAGVLSTDRYEPGDRISTDQFIVKTPGRLLSGFGREGPAQRFHGGTIYSDAGSRLIDVQFQVSLNAGETVMGKARFEEWIWNLAGVLAKEYHSDNGVFQSELYREDCQNKRQTQSFSGVGAQHQNAHAERDIQTISNWARSMMVHAAIHWPSDGADNICLWAFAVQHAAWLYNRLPNRLLGNRTPLEVFTKEKSDHRDLRRTHVWGCPVFVLDPKLQDGKKIPKFNRRARMGQFLGFSREHSSLVARVRHLSTNFVSPQYHVVFDDLFTSIMNDKRLEDTVLEDIFGKLFVKCRDYYGEDAVISDKLSGEMVPDDEPLPLDDMWLNEPERREKKQRLEERRARQIEKFKQQNADFEKLNNDFNPPYPVIPTEDGPPPGAAVVSDDEDSDGSDEDSDFDDDSIGFSAPEGDTPSPPASPDPEPPPRRSGRLRREYHGPTAGLRDGVRDGAYKVNGERLDKHPDFERCYTSLVTDSMSDKGFIRSNRERFACTLSKSKQPPHLVKQAQRLPRKKRAYKARLFRKKLSESHDSLGGMDWECPSVESLLGSGFARFVHWAATDIGYTGSIESMVTSWLHPLMLQAKASASKDDNPNWWQAMNGPFAEEFWKAACIEVETLEKMDSWSVVDRTDDMNVLPSTWAFKIKRFPDGLIKKYKARFCARGDKQIEGVDYFETYAPVVQWTTIRLLLILECLLGLVSKQEDITCAFLHAHLDEGENVYLEMPQGFKQYSKNGRARVLKLKRTLYGLKQSPRAFWKYLVGKLTDVGMEQSEFDPCLFIGERVICVFYVDDVLMWSKDETYIYELSEKLRALGVELEEEGDAAGFLGVQLKRAPDTNQIMMTQEGLIDRITDALGLTKDQSSGKSTPCMKKPLTKDEKGDPPHESYSYASIVGMLLYLAGHTRPDISYSVNCAARFTFCPKRSHEAALKHIGRYLLKTRDKGLVLTPSDDLNIDAYPDADFAGLYGYEDSSDPVCVRSRTGFVITYYCGKLSGTLAIQVADRDRNVYHGS